MPPGSATDRSKPIARWKLIFGAIALLVIGYALWQLPTWNAQAETGAAYAARIGCSCRYVQGRDAKLCTDDFEPGMEMVSLSFDEEDKTATASVPLLASRTARFAGASGCLLEGE